MLELDTRMQILLAVDRPRHPLEVGSAGACTQHSASRRAGPSSCCCRPSPASCWAPATEARWHMSDGVCVGCPTEASLGETPATDQPNALLESRMIATNLAFIIRRPQIWIPETCFSLLTEMLNAANCVSSEAHDYQIQPHKCH